VALLFVIVVWIGTISGLMIAGKATTARELATLLPNLAWLFRGLLKDPRVPRSSKLLLWFAIAWVLSPIDLVPEFVPIAGPLDDAIVAALVLRHVVHRAGVDAVTEHWRGGAWALRTILQVARVG